MGEKEFYDYHSLTYKVDTLDWSEETAAEILRDWQEKFSQEVEALVNEKKSQTNGPPKYNIYAFSSSHLNSILEQFSDFDLNKVFIGYGLMVRFIHLVLFWHYLNLNFFSFRIVSFSMLPWLSSNGRISSDPSPV